MSEQLESRLREALRGDGPNSELCDHAIDAGLRRRAYRRAALGASLVVLGVIATSVVSTRSHRTSPEPSGSHAIRQAAHRVETPVFLGPISAADHAASWSILSIEGAVSP